MGIKLIVQVLHHAPADLTAAERMVLVAIGENVRDGDNKRMTWPELNAAELARRAGLKDEALKKALQRLAKRGLEVRVPIAEGKDGRPVYAVPGRQCRYRFPKLSERLPLDVETQDEGGNTIPPSGSEGGNSFPAGGNTVPPMGGTGSRQAGTDSRPTPTPVVPPPPSEATGSPAVTSAPPVEGGGGEQQQNDEQTLAAAATFLEDLPAPWTIGPRSAAAMAPLLIKMTTEQGWHLDAALISELTKNPDGVRDHPRVVPRRISDLPKRAQPAPASTPLPLWCGHCGDGLSAAKTQAHLRHVFDDRGTARPCPNCHPAAASAA